MKNVFKTAKQQIRKRPLKPLISDPPSDRATTPTLTCVEGEVIGALAIAMFDTGVAPQRLAEQIEMTAAALDCTPAQLMATYVKDALSVFEHTPRHLDRFFFNPEFDLAYARRWLLHSITEASRERIDFNKAE